MTIISVSSSITLTGNISVPANGVGYELVANNITLDLGGFSIIGSGTTGIGIKITGSNIVIKNGYLLNHKTAIQIVSGQGVTLDSLTISSSKAIINGELIRNLTIRNSVSNAVDNPFSGGLYINTNILSSSFNDISGKLFSMNEIRSLSITNSRITLLADSQGILGVSGALTGFNFISNTVSGLLCDNSSLFMFPNKAPSSGVIGESLFDIGPEDACAAFTHPFSETSLYTFLPKISSITRNWRIQNNTHYGGTSTGVNILGAIGELGADRISFINNFFLPTYQNTVFMIKNFNHTPEGTTPLGLLEIVNNTITGSHNLTSTGFHIFQSSGILLFNNIITNTLDPMNIDVNSATSTYALLQDNTLAFSTTNIRIGAVSSSTVAGKGNPYYAITSSATASPMQPTTVFP